MIGVRRGGLVALPVHVRLMRRTERTPSGCLLWLGSLSRSGYGQITVDGVARRAHRVAWQLERGEIPEGLEVCHHCDVRNCIEITHLYVGTHAQNMADRSRRGRVNPRKKYPDAVVREVHRLAARGVSRVDIHLITGVRQNYVSELLNGRWRRDLLPNSPTNS